MRHIESASARCTPTATCTSASPPAPCTASSAKTARQEHADVDPVRFYQADSGEIQVEGRPVRIAGSREASPGHRHGAPAFHAGRHLERAGQRDARAEPGWRLQPARALVRAKLQVLMRDTGMTVDLDKLVGELPVGERQRLEILKALYRGARILILDEPTAVLTPTETDALFDTLRQLRSRGTTVLLITHKLKEIMAICDAVTVMRGGAVVLDRAIADTSIDALAEAMVGRRVQLGRGDAAVVDAHDRRGAARSARHRLARCARRAAPVERVARAARRRDRRHRRRVGQRPE
jgi:ABC-type uncharacterized transport system ATPase subunit